MSTYIVCLKTAAMIVKMYKAVQTLQYLAHVTINNHRPKAFRISK